MSADNERFMLDTNLLVYAIDSAAGARHDAAGQIIQYAVPRGLLGLPAS